MLRQSIEYYNNTLDNPINSVYNYYVFEAKNKVLKILIPMEYDEVVYETGKLKQEILQILEVNKNIELKSK